jgi:DNA (cytosine-5)-methyltransferase 1
MSPLTCIDLFSGCGGLSLGLRRAGFHPKLFCEISDYAASTYEANHRGVPRDKDAVKLAVALASLRNGKTKGKKSKRNVSYQLYGGTPVSFTCGDVDLVCGGPPCQGFSRIGHKRTFKSDKHAIPSNHLFKSMVNIIDSLRPKAFIFENVSGLLSSKWFTNDPDSRPGEIFNSILFGKEGFGRLIADKGEKIDSRRRRLPHEKRYVILWREVKSYDYGVPQNRPRVIVMGLREDLATSAQLKCLPARPFSTLQAEALEDKHYVLLPEPSTKTPWTVKEVIGDLQGLVRLIPDRADGEKRLEFSVDRSGVSRGGLSDDAKRWYLSDEDSWLRGVFDPSKIPPLTEQQYTAHKPEIHQRFAQMIRLTDRGMSITSDLRTKKFAQRVLQPTWGGKPPGITVTSLPDDFVHYSEPRIPTVREWARLQTFPDWYVFKGPRTTGGRRRAGDPSRKIFDRDVPKYTQIGNAVPVRLAFELGKRVARLLRDSSGRK